jgi:hypothetical protein
VRGSFWKRVLAQARLEFEAERFSRIRNREKTAMLRPAKSAELPTLRLPDIKQHSENP